MSTSIPLNFRASPLPADFKGTPQALLDAFVARLSAESTNAISFFATGSVAPSSNVGPWLKDGTTWYIWDTGTAAYIPLIVAAESLKYVASQSAPDPAKYTFWIYLDTTGKAQSIKYYYNGAWRDIYEDTLSTFATTTAMNAAIAAAVSGALTTRYPVKAHETSDQTVPVGTETQIVANIKDFDPSNVYSTADSAFTVPVTGYYQVHADMQVDKDTADATTMELALVVRPNGIGSSDAAAANGTAAASPPGNRWYLAVDGPVYWQAGFSGRMFLTATTTPGTGNVKVSGVSFGISLIQAA